MSKTAVAKKTASRNVATKTDQQVELFETKPDFLKGTSRGSENVGIEDMVIPRIELVQPLSPCKDDSDPAYIPEAKDGTLFNTVTRELYGKAVQIIPVYYRRQYLLFRTRKAGGGFRGSFDTAQLAEHARGMLEDPGNHEIVEAGEHFVLLMTESHVEQAMLTCTKTKLKISRQLNSLIRLKGEDRWASAYELGSVKQQNDKGTFYNYSIRPLGFVSERLYREGEKLWEQITSGERKLTTDFTDSETADGDEDL